MLARGRVSWNNNNSNDKKSAQNETNSLKCYDRAGTADVLSVIIALEL